MENKKIYVVKIIEDNKEDLYLQKYSKGYYTSSNVILNTMFHSEDAAKKAAKGYVRDIEYSERRLKQFEIDKREHWTGYSEYLKEDVLKSKNCVIEVFELVFVEEKQIIKTKEEK